MLVEDDAAGQRLDSFLSTQITQHSRSRLASWVKSGRATVDGEVVNRPSVRVESGQTVQLEPAPVPALTLEPQADVPFEVVYEDASLIVVEKPAGLTVHPGAGRPDGTLVNGLLARFGALSPIGLPQRPGIVHRIDAGTTGLLVAARTEAAHMHLAAQFAAHTAHRRYLAIVWDHGLADEGTIETTHGRHPNDRRKFTGEHKNGKRAVSHWKIIERIRPCALVECRLETGRTHQIRVHFTEMGHPLVGDPVYGRRRRIERPTEMRLAGFELGLKRQALHAAELGFEHPETGDWMNFKSPLPQELLDALALLRRHE